MVEYGVNVTNKFVGLPDDDIQDPEELLREAEAAAKKDEKTPSQKKAEKKSAQKAKKTALATAAANAAIKENEAKKQQALTASGAGGVVKREGNKENRPDGEGFRGGPRGGGRGERRGGGGRGRGRGGSEHPANLPPRLQGNTERAERGDRSGPRFGDRGDQLGPNNQQTDTMGNRFGETPTGERGGYRGGGRGGGRGYGRGGFRGGRGGFRGARGGGPPTGGFGADELGAQNEEGEDERRVQHDSDDHIGTFGDEQGEKDFGTAADGFDSAGGRPRGGYRGGRGGGDYRGGGRGGFRGGRGGVRGRQFDRLSGSDKTGFSGVKPMDKKAGFGRGNWGTEQDELTGETEPLNVTTEEAPAPEDGEAKTVSPKAGDEEAKAEAEAKQKDTTMTYEEYVKTLKLQQKRDTPKFNIRQAGEGEDAKQYKKLVPMQKDPNDPLLNESTEEEIVVTRREPRAKRLDIEINFSDEQARGGGGGGERGERGGRGGFGSRGGGRRGGGRGGGRFESARGEEREREREFAPRGRRHAGSQGGDSFVMTTESFPALGAQ